MAKAKAERPDPRQYVQVMRSPSIGIEVHTGTPWMGVDQQVGHGSADALYAMTADEYVASVREGYVVDAPLEECWRGQRPERLLFSPSARSRPSHWTPMRTRMLPPRFRGELWWHLDALTDVPDGDDARISALMAAGSAPIRDMPNGHRAMTFPLVGELAYPRPGGLIGGLTAGSSHDQARAVLGPPAADDGQKYAIEGVLVRLTFVDGGLTEIGMEHAPRRAPGGLIGAYLRALGEPERGPRFLAAVRDAGPQISRWKGYASGRSRLLFENDVELQVEADRVLMVRANLATYYPVALAGGIEPLARDLPRDATREQIHSVLGAPSERRDDVDLYDYTSGQVLIAYRVTAAGMRPDRLTVIGRGARVSPAGGSWRFAGEATMFLDLLGRPQANPLVDHARALPGVRLRMRKARISAVEVTGERLVAFIDGLPADPRRHDLPFGMPNEWGDRDDLWAVGDAWIHVHADRDGRIARVTVCIEEELPRGLAVRPWNYARDDASAWRALSNSAGD